MTTQAIIKIKSFPTALTDYMQPEQVASLVIKDAENMAEGKILSNGVTVTRSMLKSSEPIQIALNSNQLKLLDPKQYKALRSSGEIGQGATYICGLETTTYTKVIVTEPLGAVGNSGDDNQVTIMFCGKGNS